MAMNTQQQHSMQILMKSYITIGSKKKRNNSIFSSSSSSMVSSDIPLCSSYSKTGGYSSSAIEKMMTVVDLTPSAYLSKQEQQQNNSPTSSSLDDNAADDDDNDGNTARTSCVEEMTLNTETHEKFEIESRFDSVYLEDDEDYLKSLDDYGIPVVQAAAAAVDQKRRLSAAISISTMKRRLAITVGAGFSVSSSNILRESLRRLTVC
ncbi:hypothetical protein FRACYDRAFT_233238 [Fragilariopsis cylindrus CCMP1102]|uniref:Uncharacterized protein n=1 Tax=Fragilariopsis cylindrus CCMP1102 TaxID=635003 RepID=A0A1E7FY41_9STRA|nr:hypothetical protein FRACYDRAFT_233238 [Fragilariopsis cylindrus CCMP1102]|eukprot:OEU23072.1 hypothetical protein FRACYDRAFT_233238 [Fragilariopsis cylindrus CCMP1102]